TGQVGHSLLGTDAFQEADIRGITMPVTKHNYMITDPNDIPRAEPILPARVTGPVLLDATTMPSPPSAPTAPTSSRPSS
ncbi:hypothetical protein, partial [Corynebacterium sp. 49B]|uniref:hypothetical protein n=1 Tax=Corynebacterium sp. 49B TaxID=2080505 RepID=UPI001CEF8F60